MTAIQIVKTDPSLAAPPASFISVPTIKHPIQQGRFTYGCGLACILNALLSGTSQKALHCRAEIERMAPEQQIDELVKKYGMKPSNVYETGSRFRKDGMSSIDLLQTYNDVRRDHNLDPVMGRYLDKGVLLPDELLKRTHAILLNSLQGGEPPILCIRSQSAQWNSGKQDFYWESISAHFLTVIGISASVYDDGTFLLDCLDPQNAQREMLFVYFDPRNFNAKKDSTWLNGRPFLSVCGKSLDIGTIKRPWNERAITYIQYAIFKP